MYKSRIMVSCKGGTLLVVLLAILVLIAMAAGYYFYQNFYHNAPIPEPIHACVLEAKQCTDGSYIWRTGPNCEFAPCPNVVTTTTISTADLPRDEALWGWQTYRNYKYGFELRYPNNWRITTPEVQDSDFIQIDNYVTDQNDREQTMQILIYKDNPKQESGFDAEDFNYRIDNLPTKTYYFIPNQNFGLDDVVVSKQTPLIVIRMMKNNKFYRFLLFNADKITGIYNQILSTFKFIK